MSLSPTPKSNAEFWGAKFRANVDRDNRCEAGLTKMGWRVDTVWECELKEDAQSRLADLVGWLRKQ